MRRTFALACSVLVALCVIAASSPADASARHRDRVLHVRGTLVSMVVNDAGHGGPGNVIAFTESLSTGGTVVGSDWISCVNVTADVQLCHAAFVLADGQIEAQAQVPVAATTFEAAVIGGTGRFEGSTGHVTTVRLMPGTDRTIVLRAH
jgi:hypothetical protein